LATIFPLKIFNGALVLLQGLSEVDASGTAE